MEKREGAIFQKSSTWGSLFQHYIHPKEHKTQMREVWSNSKSKPVTVIQSNTPNPRMQPLAGKLCESLCASLESLSLYVSLCHSVFIAKLLEYVVVSSCYLFMCVSVCVCESCAVCGCLGSSLLVLILNFFLPACLLNLFSKSTVSV